MEGDLISTNFSDDVAESENAGRMRRVTRLTAIKIVVDATYMIAKWNKRNHHPTMQTGIPTRPAEKILVYRFLQIEYAVG
jgi:hypothetical protein